MQTKNLYVYPIDKEYIKKILTKAPAHKVFRKNDVAYDLTHAIDFLCDEGTPVKAALEGEVIAVVDNIKENYHKFEPPKKDELPEEKQDGNYVVIKHANEEFSQYSHLKYKGVLVKKCQYVKTGEIIGYSGNTGWSIEPHLHFMVFKFLKNGKGFRSLKIRWRKEL